MAYLSQVNGHRIDSIYVKMSDGLHLVDDGYYKINEYELHKYAHPGVMMLIRHSDVVRLLGITPENITSIR